MEIFILSGQSNMSGRGGIETVDEEDGTQTRKWDRKVPAECGADSGSILKLNKNLEWDEAREPLHEDVDSETPCSVGPGLVFAASLLRARKYKTEAKQIGAQIGLVPCASGGSCIADWEKGAVLYDTMIRRTRAALANGGALRALLWYQGESDAEEKSRADQYEHKLIAFFHNLRADLGHHDLPIIQVAIHWPGAANAELVEQVRSAQKAVAQQVRHVYLVDARGLSMCSDKIHLTTKAQAKLGLMMLRKYLEIEEKREGAH